MSVRPIFLFWFTFILAVAAGALTSGCASTPPGGVYKDSFVRAAERDAAMISVADLCGVGGHAGPKEMDYYMRRDNEERSQDGTRGGTRRSHRSGDKGWESQPASDSAHSAERNHTQGYGFARRGKCVIQ